MGTQNAINANTAGIVGYNGNGTFTGSALTTNAVVYAASADTLTSQSLTNGQLQIGSTGAAPVAASLIGGTGVTIVPGAGSITINATGSGLAWSVVTGSSQTMVANNGYISNATSGGVAYTLPATAGVGAILRITGLSGGSGWSVRQNAGQSIQFGVTNTTTGTGGSLASSVNTDTVELVCAVANTTYICVDSVGNITVV